MAGVIGAVTIAVWFLIVDLAYGHPLYTPTVLGSALLKSSSGLSPGPPPIDLEIVFVFTWVHGLIFVVIGALASWLLGIAERNPDIGFGILLFFVVFEFGFVAVCQVVAESVLYALAWPAVVVGNLLAAVAMGMYFWRHHLNMRVEP